MFSDGQELLDYGVDLCKSSEEGYYVFINQNTPQIKIINHSARKIQQVEVDYLGLCPEETGLKPADSGNGILWGALKMPHRCNDMDLDLGLQDFGYWGNGYGFMEVNSSQGAQPKPLPVQFASNPTAAEDSDCIRWGGDVNIHKGFFPPNNPEPANLSFIGDVSRFQEEDWYKGSEIAGKQFVYFGVREAQCPSGYIVFRQETPEKGYQYGVIEPIAIDDTHITFRWWIAEPNVTDFSGIPANFNYSYVVSVSSISPLSFELLFTNAGGCECPCEGVEAKVRAWFEGSLEFYEKTVNFCQEDAIIFGIPTLSRTLRLSNNTSLPIVGFYAVPVANDDWGLNLLNNQIDASSNYSLTLDNSIGCNYKFRAVYLKESSTASAVTVEKRDVNICSSDFVGLSESDATVIFD
ncbi:MAG: hypothetical protein F6K14_05530 [Symploca sp. SIO2C1]|nr:hypothetical protein [Symploca sp. SIO2C1]